MEMTYSDNTNQNTVMFCTRMLLMSKF